MAGRRRNARLIAALLVALAASAVWMITRDDAADQPSVERLVESVSIEDNQIVLNGEHVPMKGFVVQAFLTTGDDVNACPRSARFCDKLLDQRDFYFGRGQWSGRSALDIAHDWHANTIRLNVSQAALDPESPAYSTQYLGEIESAVEAARDRGFAVIVALFDARNSNIPDELRARNPLSPLDTEVTVRAAQTVAETFGSDPGVVFEALNEPFGPVPRKEAWLMWRDGGTADRGRFAGMTFAGVNAVIAAVRDTGAKNVIIVQGLGASFKGFPGGVNDPAGQLAYSVHPFLADASPKRLDWEGSFGSFSDENPFVITAWNNPANRPWCGIVGVETSQEFLDYLAQREIGIMGFALDVPGTIFVDFRKSLDRVTRYTSSCNGGAAGELIRTYLEELPSL